MAGAGTRTTDGQPLEGWPHVEQSIGKILTTPIGTRVMRRDFGSEIPALIDMPMTERVILAVFAATVNALDRWEPRYRLTHVQVTRTDAGGILGLSLAGTYFPRGHLGDYSRAEAGREAYILFVR